jgi:hypothetical protein
MFKGRFKTEFGGKFTQEMADGPNKDAVNKLHSHLNACSKTVDSAIKTALDAIAECSENARTEEVSLQLIHQQQELAFRQLIEKYKQHQNQSTERAALEKKRNTIIECQNESNEVRKQIKSSEKRRVELLASLSETRDRRFAVRKRVADRLNTALSPNITVSIQQDGNAEAYQELIESSMKGSGVKQNMLAQKITRTLPPSQLADLVRAGNLPLLIERGDMNAEQATKVAAVFNSNTSVHWGVAIDIGLPSGNPTNPSNIADVTFLPPSLDHSIMLTSVPSAHSFGLRVTRKLENLLPVYKVDRVLYGATETSDTALSTANFIVRGRLARFDTDNNSPDPRGLVAFNGMDAVLGDDQNDTSGEVKFGIAKI